MQGLAPYRAWDAAPARVGARSAAPGAPDAPPSDAVNDQAATLRRLFARRPVRVLPLLVSEVGATATALSGWIAKLAQCFACQGERVLVIDAARVHVAAALGLRARFDLAHVIAGDCTPAAAVLDAGHGLALLPAGRALAQARSAAALCGQLGRLELGRIDLVLLVLPAAQAHEVVGDALVPVLPDAADLAAVLPALQRALASRRAARGGPSAQRAVTDRFRLLFLGMPEPAATTLAQRLIRKLAMTQESLVQSAGSARVARDLVPVVRAAGGWTLATLPQRPLE